MSTPLSLSMPETASVAIVPAATPAGAPVTTEQVTFWTVLGLISAAAAAGVFEIVLHLAG